MDSGTEQQSGLATGAAMSLLGLLAAVFDPGALVAQSPPPHPFFLREPRNQGFSEIYFLFEFQEENKIKQTIEHIFVLGKHSKSSQL